MKKNFVLICLLQVLISTLITPNVSAEIVRVPYGVDSNGIGNRTFEEANLGNGCGGRSDYPHISAHVPNTVNVTASTTCEGVQVSIETTLSRKGWFIFRESVTKKSSGFSKVSVNVSLPCKWRVGNPPIEYIVSSFHKEARGATATTAEHRFIRC